jgi:hypothetical protein
MANSILLLVARNRLRSRVSLRSPACSAEAVESKRQCKDQRRLGRMARSYRLPESRWTLNTLARYIEGGRTPDHEYFIAIRISTDQRFRGFAPQQAWPRLSPPQSRSARPS